MKILIQIMLGSTARFIQKGNFQVNPKRFRENPNKEATRAACKWINEIRYASSYNLEILQVIYNSEHDITELVKEVEGRYE